MNSTTQRLKPLFHPEAWKYLTEESRHLPLGGSTQTGSRFSHDLDTVLLQLSPKDSWMKRLQRRFGSSPAGTA